MTYTILKYKVAAPKPHLFIGSKIRGMLGYALKEEVCINPSYRCKGCFAANECTFYDMYEKSNTTHYYRLDFDLYEKRYKFSIYLFGILQQQKDAISKAMMKVLFPYGTVEVKSKTKKIKKYKTVPKVIKLTFITPLRIKKQNRFVKKEIGITELLRSIHKRAKDLGVEKLPILPLENEGIVVSQNFRYQELVRRSNKQNTTMKMGGLMGEIVISDMGKEAYRLLKLGEIIGVGKATVFGLGKIKIEEIA